MKIEKHVRSTYMRTEVFLPVFLGFSVVIQPRSLLVVLFRFPNEELFIAFRRFFVQFFNT